ncbi:Aste57867_20503 [Aphanomyces stellatus]|uniref:Aste57867_20503 protein n=1 Tax=Aphanomyces stellatus TaxID=120398 RepID=A0A485LF85_9STRA|nr:hypothetical protein As57867_020437 [Aphanomyces stellatus]VFT97188.1 Aste57867_20503 [Aphanomyces stellatus]
MAGHEMRGLWVRDCRKFQGGKAFRARAMIHRNHKWLQTLQQWVAASVVPMPLSRGSVPWLHSTLLADPRAREVGYRWITDRVYHTATPASTNGNMADHMHMELVTSDTGSSLYIVGVERMYQTTFFGHFQDVANCIWDASIQHVHSDTSCVTTITPFSDDHTILYSRLHDTRLGTSMCVLTRRYDEPNRVVLATALLANDECFPLQPAELRPHGVAWTLVQRITDNVTLFRSESTQFAPRTTDGPMTLERNAAMCDVAVHPTTASITVARIQESLVRNFVARRQFMDKDINDRLELRHDAAHTSTN